MYVLEFKRTSDQRHDYREQGERRTRDQHDFLVKSLDTVAKEAKGENAGHQHVTLPTCMFEKKRMSAYVPTLACMFLHACSEKNACWHEMTYMLTW